MRSIRIFGIILFIAAASAGGLLLQTRAQAESGVSWETDLRKPKNPDTYGNVLLNRNTRDSALVKPVVFPHWVHRAKYACKVCHTDLGFSFKAGTADIKTADIRNGKYCGACHNGKTAFDASTQCEKCHSFGINAPRGIGDRLKDLPKDYFGNQVNWVKAVSEGKIKPAADANGTGAMTGIDMDIIIPATKMTPHPPDVKYPHKAHTELLDCASCHESIFKQKQGGNPDMNMIKIMSGQYCGVCHSTVAFPLEDCFRCHSQPAAVVPDTLKEEPAKTDTKAPAPAAAPAPKTDQKKK